MKSAPSVTLIVCLVLSALPATAQEKTDTPAVSFDVRGPAPQPTAGPFTRAITREAIRLAAAGESTSSGVEAVHQADTPARSDWSRVRKLAPGTEVVVTVQGGQPRKRHVVLADESELTALNLSDATLPVAATRVLLDLASNHPEYLAAAEKRGSFVNGSVRLGPDGVFVADRKVAGLGQIVEKIRETDVVEIRGLTGTGGPNAVQKRALIGAAAGAVTGLLFGFFYASGACDGGAGCERNVALSISGAGAGIGAVIGALSRHDTQDIIYRAP